MKRIPQLDGLRGIAVLMVFVYHAFQISHAARGVDLFFVLSGYLITGILLRSKEKRAAEGYWWRFYSRRIKRILPAYAGFLLFLTVVFTVPWGRVWYWYAFFGANVASAFGKTPLRAMGPLWSLAVEEQFYFLWPLVVLLCSRKMLRRVAVALIVLPPVLRAAFTSFFSDYSPIYCLTPFRVDMLAVGAFIAISEMEDAGWLERNRRTALFTIIGSGVALALLSRLPGFRITANSLLFNSIGYSLIVVAFGAVLAWSLTLRGGPVYGLLTLRPLRYMGLISYTFYLYQLPILEKMGERVHSQLAVAALGFVLTAAFSAVSWRFFESRILKTGKRPARAHAEETVKPEVVPVAEASL
jgi:peptidoglycan/LPS O-acetylase OafA/YrhL